MAWPLLMLITRTAGGCSAAHWETIGKGLKSQDAFCLKSFFVTRRHNSRASHQHKRGSLGTAAVEDAPTDSGVLGWRSSLGLFGNRDL